LKDKGVPLRNMRRISAPGYDEIAGDGILAGEVIDGIEARS
jgi:hypothetical protein